jgi:hypothetical protein
VLDRPVGARRAVWKAVDYGAERLGVSGRLSDRTPHRTTDVVQREYVSSAIRT